MFDDETVTKRPTVSPQELQRLEEARERYGVERDKRNRPEGSAQYTAADKALARNATDPYSDPIRRAPVEKTIETLIVGSGWAGILAAVRLSQAGEQDFLIIDKSGDFGGTWYWNRYPGAQCDIESYIYLPVLEETGYTPKEKYSFQPEIFEYARSLGRQFDLYDRALFQTQAKEIRWDEENGRHIVKTDAGDTILASFVILSTGPLSKPKLPGIPGLSAFKGHTFHTSRWDYAYTGGNQSGGLTKLEDKRVALVGAGATAVQVVPMLAEHAMQLTVLQRTPSVVGIRGNSATDPQWASTLKPGWQEERMRNFASIMTGGKEPADLVDDGWTDLARTVGAGVYHRLEGLPPEEQAIRAELADLDKMDALRDRVAAIVHQPDVAYRLKPQYRLFCKRPTFHDHYLPAFNKPNVTLVDCPGGVEKISDHTLSAGGKDFDVDCIIFATGYEVGTSVSAQTGCEIIGTGGLTLSQHWSKNPRTYHGLFSHHFPNLFFIGATQTGITINFSHALNEQASHIAHVIHEAKQMGKRRIEAREDAENEWIKIIHESNAMGRMFFRECTPGYFNNEGKPDSSHGFALQQYGGGPLAFFALLKAWRESGTMAGLRLS